MQQETLKYIEKITNIVRNRYDVHIPVDNIDSLIEKMGGTVIEDSERLKESEDPDMVMAGAIEKYSDRAFTIVIRSYEKEEQRSYAVANLLGFLILHKGYLLPDDTWSEQDEHRLQTFDTAEQENQADAFAMMLLMPKEEYIEAVMRYAKDDGRISIKKLAGYFHISTSQVERRGKDLGILRSPCEHLSH